MLSNSTQAETVSITYASLCIYGEDLQPDSITERLKTNPTSSVLRGDPIRKSVFARRGAWILSSKDILKSDDASNHIIFLADGAGIDSEELLCIYNEGFELRIYVYWLSKAGNGGPVISLEGLQALVRMRAELHVDVYFECGENV